MNLESTLTRREIDLYETMDLVEQDILLKHYLQKYAADVKIALNVLTKENGRLSQEYYLNDIHLGLYHDGFHSYVRILPIRKGMIFHPREEYSENNRLYHDGGIYWMTFNRLSNVMLSVAKLFPDLTADRLNKSICLSLSNERDELGKKADRLQEEQQDIETKMQFVVGLTDKYNDRHKR